MSAPEEIVCETEDAFWRTCTYRVGMRLMYGSTLKPGDSVTFGNVTIVYRPPPPRDEAREAFEKWWDLGAIGISTISQKEGCHRAFLAGRASVKP